MFHVLLALPALAVFGASAGAGTGVLAALRTDAAFRLGNFAASAGNFPLAPGITGHGEEAECIFISDRTS